MKTDQEIEDFAKLCATWFTNKRGSYEEQQLEFYSYKQGSIDGYKSCQRDAELRNKERAELIQHARDESPMDASQEAAHYNWLDDQNEKLKSEIQSLKSQLNEKDAQLKARIEMLSEFDDRIGELQSREQKLVECVKFYAQDSINHSNYHAMMGTDLNKCARETLKELGYE